jgi:hypothetical protein
MTAPADRMLAELEAAIAGLRSGKVAAAFVLTITESGENFEADGYSASSGPDASDALVVALESAIKEIADVQDQPVAALQ